MGVTDTSDTHTDDPIVMAQKDGADPSKEVTTDSIGLPEVVMAPELSRRLDLMVKALRLKEMREQHAGLGARIKELVSEIETEVLELYPDGAYVNIPGTNFRLRVSYIREYRKDLTWRQIGKYLGKVRGLIAFRKLEITFFRDVHVTLIEAKKTTVEVLIAMTERKPKVYVNKIPEK